MGYRVGWANAAQTCVYCQVIGKWTWPEFDEMLEEGRELVANSPHNRLGIIINLSDSRVALMDPTATAIKFASKWPEKLVIMVLIAVPVPLQMFCPVMDRLFPQLSKNVVMAEGVDEALATVASFTG